MIKQSDVTIIIPHLGANRESQYALNQCISSLNETVPNIKKIVVVNGDKQPKNPYPNYLIEADCLIGISEQGQCKAVNAAAATVNTPWIFVTNDDMVYAPGWWEALTNFLSDSVLCVSPKLVEPRKGAPTFIEYFCGGAGGDFDKQKFLDFVANYDQFKERDLDTGFNLPFLIKKELWDTVGGYDINYDPWGSNSDSDLEYKVKLAGVQSYQNPSSLVYHFSQTSGTFNPENNEHYQHNFQVFKDKWGFPRTDEGIWEANFKMPETPERKFRPIWENTYGF